MNRPTVEYMGGARGLEGADVTVAPGVVVECATLTESGEGWGVWGVRIDGHLYREPRDLSPEPLHDGAFKDMLERGAEQHRAAYAKGEP